MPPRKRCDRCTLPIQLCVCGPLPTDPVDVPTGTSGVTVSVTITTDAAQAFDEMMKRLKPMEKPDQSRIIRALATFFEVAL